MGAILITLIISTIISILWVKGINNIPNDYKGEDFLN